MRAGIICYRDANGADAWIGLQVLERHGGGGEFCQIGMAIDASKCIIRAGSITFGTGSHDVLREFCFYFTSLKREKVGLMGIPPKKRKRELCARVFSKKENGKILDWNCGRMNC
jgi:hypothetical protein